MKDAKGIDQTERQSIADTFATFYEQLYEDMNKGKDNDDDTMPTIIPITPFTNSKQRSDK